MNMIGHMYEREGKLVNALSYRHPLLRVDPVRVCCLEAMARLRVSPIFLRALLILSDIKVTVYSRIASRYSNIYRQGSLQIEI